ncbi:MAG: AMP-binding protein [Hyphomonadaceae bacterium]
MADQSRSRNPVARARQPGGEYSAVASPLSEPVARSLEYWAATRGGRPALFEGETVLTYRDWNEYADMLADAFAGRGLHAGEVVAVRCRNRIEWAVIALACAKIDARLLTLDSELTTSALRERIITSGASAVIVGDMAPVRIAPALDGMPLKLRATMDGAYPGFYNFWDLFPPVAQPRFGRAQPSLLAWTAGKTGRPLPVGVPPRRAAPASMSRPPVPETGVSLMTVPMHKVWGPVQFWNALVAGRAVALMRSFDPAAALKIIAHRHVTHWSALPETFLELRRLGTTRVRTADTSSLQEVIIGGAPGPWTLKAWLRDVFGSIVSEAYGSTETGLIATMPIDMQVARPGSCGRPIRGVSVEIRDARGQRLPPDSVGEIWARSPRSLECDLPLASQRTRRDEDGFVATGDEGRIDTDGFIYITGKSDLSGSAMRHAG